MSATSVTDADLSCLHKATISYDYLHTNSTTHEFLFGAIAELVDNSRDAGANNLHIDADSESAQLSVLDDGCGMDRDEAISVVSFGHSLKKMEAGMIGQYGNGLKSGALRIGKDFIMFTKKNGVLTCLLLSQTFHENSHLKDIFVPTPSFSEDRRMMSEDSHRHSVEMGIIYKYSPFSTQDELFSQFDRIPGPSGTLIVVFNIRRIDTGELELELNLDPHDIKLSKYEEQREEERNSLRAYLAVLYIHPRMKIHLRGKKVKTIRILNTLYSPFRYKYLAKNLKSCAAKEYDSCVKKKKDALDLLNQAKSELGTLMNCVTTENGHFGKDKELRVRQRKLQMRISDREKLLEQCVLREKEALKAKSSPAPLVFHYGLNIHHRNRYGCMIYNNGRLIEMYERPAAQKEKNDLMMRCLGVVGLVDVPYSVLEPTHNKQGFANHRERQALLKAMNDHMEQYWSDVGIGATPGGIKMFWKQFGYDDTLWSSACSNMLAERIKRFQKTGHVVQCNNCLKWRHIDYQRSYMENGIPDDWTCDKHPNSALRNCARKEDEAKEKEGRLVMKSPEPQRITSHTSNRNNSIRNGPVIKSEFSRLAARDDVPAKPPPRRAAASFNRRRSPTPSSSEDELPVKPTRRGTQKQVESDSDTRRRVSNVSTSSRNREVVASQERQVGRPPMKRPSRTEKAVVESEEESSGSPVEIVPKKPKTKADLRRRMESERNTAPAPPPSSSRRQTSAETTPNDLPTSSRKTNGTAAPTADVDEYVKKLEKERNDAVQERNNAVQERNNSMSAMKTIFSALAKQGSKAAGELRLASDDKLLEVNADTLMRNFMEEAVLKPERERNEEKLKELSMRRVYPTFEDLTTDIHTVLNWATQEYHEGDPLTKDNCYQKLRELSNMLVTTDAAAQPEPE